MIDSRSMIAPELDNCSASAISSWVLHLAPMVTRQGDLFDGAEDIHSAYGSVL